MCSTSLFPGNTVKSDKYTFKIHTVTSIPQNLTCYKKCLLKLICLFAITTGILSNRPTPAVADKHMMCRYITFMKELFDSIRRIYDLDLASS